MFDSMFPMSQKTSSLLRSIDSTSRIHFSDQEQNSQQASNHDNIQTLSPTTPGFFLGISDYKSLDATNLPDFVKEHQTTLTFPEKVGFLNLAPSFDNSMRILYRSTIPNIFMFLFTCL
jgi:hypothetical protein